jgi:putative protease
MEVVEKTRPDQVYTLEEDSKGTYLLNSKDLCLVRYLPELKAAGICSFKVEGRTKGIHYVATVGQVYREAIDHEGNASPEQIARWEETLEESANRGFTEGFLHGKPGSTAYTYESAQSTSQATFVASAEGELNPQGLLRVQGRNRFKAGESLVWMTPEGLVSQTMTDIMDEHGFKTDVVQPNQVVWITPPQNISHDALRWALLRRKEQASLAG